MNESTDIAARVQRFNQSVREFAPKSSNRYAKLIPFKDGIVDLRAKGASLRLIRELLATNDVAVGMETIAKFVAEINGTTPTQRSNARSSRKRGGKQQSAPPLTRFGPAPVAQPSPVLPSPQPQSEPPSAAAPTEPFPTRQRNRGPRIADPSNL